MSPAIRGQIKAIHATGRARRCRGERVVPSLGESDAGAPPFFANLQRRAILEPLPLMQHEHALDERVDAGREMGGLGGGEVRGSKL